MPDEVLPDAPAAPVAPSAPVEAADTAAVSGEAERYVGDPNRYVTAEGEAKNGTVAVQVGEFAGSIVDAKIEAADGTLTDVDSFDAKEIGLGAAEVTVKGKNLAGTVKVRLSIPAD